MPINITIDHRDESEHSNSNNSYSDEEGDSSGTGVQISPSSGIGSHEYAESLDESDGWVLDAYPDDIGPSDSASRPRTSNQHRPIVDARAAPAPPLRRTSGRHERHEIHERVLHREPLPRSSRRPPPPNSAESVDPSDEYPGGPRGHPRPSHLLSHGHWREAPGPGYAQSFASAPAYHSYSANDIAANASQLIPFGAQGGYGYPPPHPYSPAPLGPGAQGYFPPAHPGAGHMGAPMPPRGSPYPGQEMVGYGQGQGYYHNQPQQPFGMAPNISAPVYYQLMQSPPGAPSPESAKEDGIARLEKFLLDQKKEAEEKEAKAKKDAEDKAAADAKAAAEAAEKQKAADEAKAREDAAAAAAAASAAAAAPPPEEKKKPIKFKDAVGRKFSFPFHLCKTWAGMEDLIRQAFAHIDVIGRHVADGHYDLIGPDGDIILPQVWETVIEPDWAITMHMWPIPEPPPPGSEPPKPDGPEQVVLVAPGGQPNVLPGGGKGGNRVKIGRRKSLAGPRPPPPPPAPVAPGGAGPPPGVLVVNPKDAKKQAQKLPGYLAWAAGSATKGKPAKKVRPKT